MKSDGTLTIEIGEAMLANIRHIRETRRLTEEVRYLSRPDRQAERRQQLIADGMDADTASDTARDERAISDHRSQE